MQGCRTFQFHNQYQQHNWHIGYEHLVNLKTKTSNLHFFVVSLHGIVVAPLALLAQGKHTPFGPNELGIIPF